MAALVATLILAGEYKLVQKGLSVRGGSYNLDVLEGVEYS